MSIPYCVCAKIPKDVDILRDKGRHRENTKAIVSAKGDRNTGSGTVPGPYPYVGERATEV